MTTSHAGEGLPPRDAKTDRMSGHTAQRTLVKSPPELWAELSDAAALAKHLGEFGEIRITRLEPETVVAWEGDRANGTVSLEPAGWGTKVTITASPVAAPEPEPSIAIPDPAPPEPPAARDEPAQTAPAAITVEIEQDAEIDDAREAEAATVPKRTLLTRLKRWLNGGGSAWQLSDDPPPAPEATEDDEPAAEPAPPAPIRLEPRPAEPDPAPPAAAEATPLPLADGAIAGVLTDALDTLGAAHHRPFSRG